MLLIAVKRVSRGGGETPASNASKQRRSRLLLFPGSEDTCLQAGPMRRSYIHTHIYNISRCYLYDLYNEIYYTYAAYKGSIRWISLHRSYAHRPSRTATAST